ncbi:MAG TPA: glucose 1-dehydrogenase [Geobacteraceae bacterium]|nr:glucose 1-dehydrogenase [Geobacteraceae bacterium]
MPLKEKVAIITGGAQGIGRAIAKTFLEKGCRTVIADIDLEAGGETVEEYSKIGKIEFIPADISSEKEIGKLIGMTAERFARIDVLVNNAGISANLPLENLQLEEWNRVIGVNLTGPFLCTKYAAPYLRQSNGSIVNIASTRAFMSEPGTEAYSASKGGIVALTHALAVSLGPDVRVNCISPGWIDASGWKKKSRRCYQELSEADHHQHPAGRVGKPEDIAALTAFLVSGEASFITGANFIVDGGMTRKMIYI